MSNPESNPQFNPSSSFSNLPLTPKNIRAAHRLIQPYIHRTPLLTCHTLNNIASTPRYPGAANSQINLYFKCENHQKIGAFKARGAHHAVIRLIESEGIEEVRRKGVVTHSSGNHAQALALAASTFDIPAYIIMPSISTPSKIAATKALTPNVIFSGSTSQEREQKVKEVIAETRAVLVPPYDHADIVLGQGTVGVEMEAQFAGRREGQVCTVRTEEEGKEGEEEDEGKEGFQRPEKQLDAIIAPCGGGGLLAGIATYFSSSTSDNQTDPSSSISQTQSYQQSPPAEQEQQIHGHAPTTRRRRTPLIFGAEPSFQGADDARRSLASGSGERITTVKSLTIADGLRTPLGRINWEIIKQPDQGAERKVEGIYSVSEEQIKSAMRLLLERAKWVVEPSGAVALAVVLFDEGFRKRVEERQEEGRPWNIGIVISGGNTTVDAIASLFRPHGQDESAMQRQKATVSMYGHKVAENIPG